MSTSPQKYDDEFDAYAFFETLWKGKWKIIALSLIGAMISVLYFTFKPVSYKVSTPISGGSQSVFLPYTTISRLLKERNLLYDKEINKFGYTYDKESIFNLFIDEFNDLEEISEVISKVDFVQLSFKELDAISKERSLKILSNNFKIIPPTKKQKKWLLQSVWPDDSQAIYLFDSAIKKTLHNLKQKLNRDIDQFIEIIDTQNKLLLTKLNGRAKVFIKIQKELLMERKQYLMEQYDIARKLDIATNKFDSFVSSKSSQDGISFNINSKDVPYYLRGYKAIGKEIEILTSKIDSADLLTANNYFKTPDMDDQILSLKFKLTEIENDLSATELRAAKKIIETANEADWINYDFSISVVEKERSLKYYFLVSLFLGGMIGVIYVLIMTTISKRQQKLV